MHEFDDLICRSTSFTLNALKKLENEIKISDPSINHIKSLQMIQLQKSIIVIGLFSLSESILQNRLNCSNGFKTSKSILKKTGKLDLLDRFNDFYCAINVLKHGEGKCYNYLLERQKTLPFKVKKPDEDFFSEGDVSEVSTLIKVDNKFVLDCAELIKDFFSEIKKEFLL